MLNNGKKILILKFLGFEIINMDGETWVDLNPNVEEAPLSLLKHIPFDCNLAMQVVEKIESLKYRFEIFSQWSVEKEVEYFVNIQIGSIEYSGPDLEFTTYWENNNKIQAIYNACVDFIEWYNENIKKTTFIQWLYLYI